MKKDTIKKTIYIDDTYHFIIDEELEAKIPNLKTIIDLIVTNSNNNSYSLLFEVSSFIQIPQYNVFIDIGMFFNFDLKNLLPQKLYITDVGSLDEVRFKDETAFREFCNSELFRRYVRKVSTPSQGASIMANGYADIYIPFNIVKRRKELLAHYLIDGYDLVDGKMEPSLNDYIRNIVI